MVYPQWETYDELHPLLPGSQTQTGMNGEQPAQPGAEGQTGNAQTSNARK